MVILTFEIEGTASNMMCPSSATVGKEAYPLTLSYTRMHLVCSSVQMKLSSMLVSR